jgi:putative transposase
MPDGGYKIRYQEAVHFITFAVVEWVDVFSRQEYRDTVVQSIAFCQQRKGLRLHGWVMMTNHLHMLISAGGDTTLSDILRDFKKYTSNEIITAIEKSSTESRQRWMMEIFREAGRQNARNTTHQFWQQDNMPMECFSYEFTRQKLDYIHRNPVAAGIVSRPEDYLYSSAGDYAGVTGLLKIDFLW